MVFDSIKNCATYYGMHKSFEKAFDFIRKVVQENLPVGKYDIEGREIFASVQEYNSKTDEQAKNEAHKNYIDIQYVVSGTEIIESVEIEKAVANTEYNAEKDVMFYQNSADAVKLVLVAGEYAILYPQDVHRPGLCVGAPATVKKIVVKVKL